MDPSPLGSPAGTDGVSGVDTNALDEALAESPIEKVTRLRREARRKKRGAGHKSAAAALELAQKHVPFFDLVKAIPDTNKYLASIEEPSLVVGVAPGPSSRRRAAWAAMVLYRVSPCVHGKTHIC